MSTYLVVAYIVIWALPLLLLYSIWARQRHVERQLDELAARLPVEDSDPN